MLNIICYLIRTVAQVTALLIMLYMAYTNHFIASQYKHHSIQVCEVKSDKV